MFCSRVQLVKSDRHHEDVKPLPCRSWGCEYCRPNRRRQLIARAASGNPNKILTLTVRPRAGKTPLERRDELHNAWTRLVKRILRQFALPPDRRWKLQGSTRTRDRERQVRRITARTAQKGIERLPYAAFIERTKLGEPHLHILLRCPFVPQDWIAEQMRDMTGAPVCWIEEIKNTGHAVSYCAKYVGKEPAQFGNRKRYWFSKNWEENSGDAFEKEPIDWRTTSIAQVWFDQQVTDRLRSGWVVDALDDGWVRWHRPGTPRATEIRAAWAAAHGSG